ncbi:hypothetical protein RRG08_026109 [Elysia crispata]|uniref:Uncharacterized protein n=1 Tax=Elysia crispata TaxID=231223 RepID=A0AAE0YR45_9GAST|nr:hypothetical protein RRG08_026109 [Elysia crispata]
MPSRQRLPELYFCVKKHKRTSCDPSGTAHQPRRPPTSRSGEESGLSTSLPEAIKAWSSMWDIGVERRRGSRQGGPYYTYQPFTSMSSQYNS